MIEVLSPGTRRRDLTRKRSLYEDRGVGEYWLVDPDTCTVTSLRRVGGQFAEPTVLRAEAGDALETRSLPGLSLNLQKLFT